MEQLKITKVTQPKEFEGQYGKSYKYGIQTEQYPDKWINGFSKYPTLEIGGVLFAEITEHEQYGLQFKIKEYKAPNKATKVIQAMKNVNNDESREENIRWCNALNNATLLVAHGKEELSNLENCANEIYKMQPNKNLKEKLQNADWANQAQPSEDTIEVEQIPF